MLTDMSVWCVMRGYHVQTGSASGQTGTSAPVWSEVCSTCGQRLTPQRPSHLDSAHVVPQEPISLDGRPADGG